MSEEKYWIYFESRCVRPALVFFLLPDLDKNYSFDIFDHITFPISAFPSLSAIQIHNDLYITGGQGYHNQVVNSDVFAFSLNPNDYTLRVVRKPDMKSKRMKHAIVNVEDKHLYVVGGYGENKLNSCERFTLRRNKWTPLPALNVPRVSPAAYYLLHYIYVIGGYVPKRYTNFTYFERLDVNDEEAGWSLHRLKEGNKLISRKAGSGTLAYSPYDILIFGGSANTYGTFNIKLNTIGFKATKLDAYHGVPYDDKYRSIVGYRHKEKVYIISECTNKRICWLLRDKYWGVID